MVNWSVWGIAVCVTLAVSLVVARLLRLPWYSALLVTLFVALGWVVADLLFGPWGNR